MISSCPQLAYGLQRVAPGKGTVALAPGREECRRWSQTLGVTEASEEWYVSRVLKENRVGGRVGKTAGGGNGAVSRPEGEVSSWG